MDSIRNFLGVGNSESGTDDTSLLQKAFEKADTDHSGTLSAEECHELLSSSSNFGDEDFSSTLEKTAKDGNGGLRFDQFIAVYKQVHGKFHLYT